ncbi:hypothetical protein [Mesorhizobium caraganae]|uniref:hypothetical protein n=1 Tax=Mesorhizobium caraganae TaxID=483206 RepID=UPI0017818E2C|nr:hypothetical protein [Mesorhizobium caraganae]
MDIAATISAVTAAIGLAKEIRSIDAQIDQAELRLKIADLTSSLAEAKMGLVDVADQLRQKDNEIARLSAFEGDLSDKIFKDGFHMDAFEDGTPKGDPYCPYCIERKMGLFRLHHLDKPGRPSGCPHCKTVYVHAPHYFYEKRG